MISFHFVQFRSISRRPISFNFVPSRRDQFRSISFNYVLSRRPISFNFVQFRSFASTNFAQFHSISFFRFPFNFVFRSSFFFVFRSKRKRDNSQRDRQYKAKGGLELQNVCRLISNLDDADLISEVWCPPCAQKRLANTHTHNKINTYLNVNI